MTLSEPVAVTGEWYTIACAPAGDVAATVSGGPTTWTLGGPAGWVETCTVTIVATQVTDTDASTTTQ